MAVLGPSGSGKSTFLHLAAGLDRPSAGIVRAAGRSLSELDEDGLALHRARGSALVFQRDNLWPQLGARANVELTLRLAGADDVRDGPMRPWPPSAWLRVPTIARPSSPAASSSAWPSPPPLLAGPARAGRRADRRARPPERAAVIASLERVRELHGATRGHGDPLAAPGRAGRQRRSTIRTGRWPREHAAAAHRLPRGHGRLPPWPGVGPRAVRASTWRSSAARRSRFSGRSGSGKTTLLHVLGGLVAPTAGRVEWQGGPLPTVDELLRAIARPRPVAYVFQGANLLQT